MLRSYGLEICLMKELPSFRIDEVTSSHYRAKTMAVPYSTAHSEKQVRSSPSSLESLPHHLLCLCSGKTKTHSWSPFVY